jgi:hypothetical protein
LDKINGGEICPVLAAAKSIQWIYSYNIPQVKTRDTPSITSKFQAHDTQYLPHW